MKRKIEINFPDHDIKVTAILLDEEEPEMCDLFWKHLKKPLKFYCHHTVSTGQVILGWRRSSLHPVKIGSQTKPIGRTLRKSTEMVPGMIQYTGASMRFAYGGFNTEPVTCAGPVIAIVEKDDLPFFKKAGEIAWDAQKSISKKNLVTYTVERKENK